jgi:hypothetical protein
MGFQLEASSGRFRWTFKKTNEIEEGVAKKYFFQR